MPPNIDKEKFEEMFKLTRENNRMLRAMRRNAFLGTVLKLAMYAAIVLFTLWSYLTYVAPLLDQVLKTMQQVQGTGTQAQVQLQGLQEALQKAQQYIPSLPKSQ